MKRIPCAVLLMTLCTAVPACATSDWSGWWLPANYAQHGVAIDSLFDGMLWTVSAVFAAVHMTLIICLIRYRRRDRKARFVKGSIRWELIWTALFTFILGGLAAASAKVWDGYRYSSLDPNAANILVIGQQFKWNIIYPGKDGKFGRYLSFPKPTDRAWPHKPGDPRHLFMGVPGPASLSYPQAVAAINQFIAQYGVEFALGKDLGDPSGMDDDFEDALGRTLFLPVNRQVHIEVLSRDVIHDFYLPNFRVQLYAVPGMVGSLTFTPTETTAEMEAPSRRAYSLDELEPSIGDAEYRTVETNRVITPVFLQQLKAAGITQINAYRPAHLELVCNQLCGVGHSQMKTDVVVLSQEEYHQRFE